MTLQLGRVVATPDALALLTPADAYHLLSRHSRGDWGELGADDKAANDRALATGERVLSSYEVGGLRFWIITEADRSVTTILTPEGY
jgi:hypothetical protein